MKTIRDVPPARKNESALVRIDLNIEGEDIRSSLRIERSAGTLRALLEKGYRLVLISHRGRPSGEAKRDAHLSLAEFAPILSKKTGVPVSFIPHMDASKAREFISEHPSRAYLLENIRFFPQEEKDDALFAKKLASLGDIYVNDAFSVSHRAHASVHAVARFLPAYAGGSLEQELHALSQARRTARHPFVLVLGGAKVSDKLPLLQALYGKSDAILTGGGIANTLFVSHGIPVGTSLYERDFVSGPSGEALEKFRKKTVLPADVVVRDGRILDVGPRTVSAYGTVIRSAAYVVWNGPLGDTDNPLFRDGSAGILDAVCKSRGQVIIGGGETTSFILKRRNTFPKNVFLSTGGGAMLEFLSGTELPGVAALK